jgi:hypothetical protein
MLDSRGEGLVTSVFSERIQSFNPELEPTELLILITNRSLFLMDKKNAFCQKRQELTKLRSIIMIRSNPCIFALSFGGLDVPLLLSSFRRSELILFLLTHTKDNIPKVKVERSTKIRFFMKDPKTKAQTTKVVSFDKVAITVDQPGLNKATLEKIEKKLQLNNVVNAIYVGNLRMRTNSFLKGTKWEETFVVLSNVGLLYFSDPTKPPIDLFPVLDCEIIHVPAN